MGTRGAAVKVTGSWSRAGASFLKLQGRWAADTVVVSWIKTNLKCIILANKPWNIPELVKLNSTQKYFFSVDELKQLNGD